MEYIERLPKNRLLWKEKFVLVCIFIVSGSMSLTCIFMAVWMFRKAFNV